MNVLRAVIGVIALLLAMLASLSAVETSVAQPAVDAGSSAVAIARTVIPLDGLLCRDNQNQLYLSRDGRCDWQLLPVNFSSEKPAQTCASSSSWEYSPTGICGSTQQHIRLPSLDVPVIGCASGTHDRLRLVSSVDLCLVEETPFSQRPLILITDSLNNRIQKFFYDGGFIDAWGSEGDESGKFVFPAGIDVDRDGNSYVADWGNKRVQRFDSFGIAPSETNQIDGRNGELSSPTGIAIDRNAGFVYTADAGQNRIYVFDFEGKPVTSWGEPGNGAGHLNNPWGIAVDQSGLVYVADTGNHRIQIFDSQGNFIRKWGTSGAGTGQFQGPIGIAIDRWDQVYVTDYNQNRVQVFDRFGSYLRGWGSFGTAPGEFFGPVGIDVDVFGQVYVVDSANHRVQVFDQYGGFLRSWGTAGSGDGEFSNPYFVTLVP